MTRDILGALRQRRFPIRFEYGPVTPTPEQCSHGLIIVERDPESDDVAKAVQGAHGPPGPRARAVRVMACRATIFGKSSKVGARRQDHEHACEVLIDGFHVAVDEWCQLALTGTGVQFGGGRYTKAGDLNFVEKFSGVQYVMRFGVSRGVRAVPYEESIPNPLTQTPAGVGGTVEIPLGDGTTRVVDLP